MLGEKRGKKEHLKVPLYAIGGKVFICSMGKKGGKGGGDLW